METGFPLEQVFTAQGALVAAAAVTAITQLLKKFVPFLPDGGRGVLWMVAGLSAAIVALAVLDSGAAIDAQGILNWVMTWATVATAAVGAFEAGTAVMAASTEPAPQG